METLGTITDVFEEFRDLGCSDAHLDGDRPPAYRIRGEIHFSQKIPVLTISQIAQMIRVFFSDEEQSLLAEKNALDTVYVYDGVRYRIHVHATNHTFSIAIRSILDASVLDFDQLRLPPILKLFVAEAHGLVLIVGPTGGGKTTMRAAITEHINASFQKHIIILEGICEFEHRSRRSLIRQYRTSIEKSATAHHDALISALRESPDIIIFGDMRDPKVIPAALNMAATGHLVIAEIHAGNVQHALYRIVGSVPAEQQLHLRDQLAELLIGVVAQRLIKKGTDEIAPIAEILVNTEAIKSLIRSGKFSAIPV